MIAADVRARCLLDEIYCERKVGVEIGVYKGALSYRLLASNPRLFLFMVDPWAPTHSAEYKATGDEIAEFGQSDHDDTMRQAMEAVSPYQGQFEVIRGTSEDAVKRFKDGMLDFVFIDGDHSYRGCSLDIALWWPKLKAGGLMSGHDFRTDKDYGVIKAVKEFAGREKRKVRLGGNYTWFATK
jgi:hypothetical protein